MKGEYRIENKKQLANALTALKAEKAIERDGDGNYRLRVSGETKPGKRGSSGRRPRAEATSASPVPAPQGDGRLAIQLEQLERAAQDVLDDYLFSLADPAMLTPLRAARDAARAARARWQTKEDA